MRVGCSFPLRRHRVSSDCASLKAEALKLLIGHGGLDKFPELRVAAFGNTNTSSTGDWVPFVVERAPGDTTDNGEGGDGICSNVVLSLHVDIAFAHVGAVANPQAKVVGMRLEFGQPQDIRFVCLGQACERKDEEQQLEIATSVAFVDVTRPAVERFAEFPVIEARFPYDFFYPFASSFDSDRVGAAAAGAAAIVHLDRTLLIAVLFFTLYEFVLRPRD